MALALLAGCPPPPVAPPPVAPPPVAPPPVAPAPAPVAPPPAPAGEAPAAAPAPIPVTVTPPPAPAPGAPARLKLGAVLALGRDAEGREAQLGVAGVTGGPEPRADLRVMLGPLAAPVRARPGLVVAVGQGLLEVVAVDVVARAVDVRWARPLPAPPAPVDLLTAPRARDDGAVVFREMSLGRLPDGAWVAVGNVVQDGAPVVGLHVYPPSYLDDPLQDYDRHPGAAAGARLEGTVRRLVVAHVEPGDLDARRFGYVALRGVP